MCESCGNSVLTMPFFSRHAYGRTIALGFAAGALSTLVFHQLAIGLLYGLGAVPNAPYALRPVPPLGVSSVLNLAFWGGVWGIVWALVAERMPSRWPAWLAGLVFGAIAPTLVGWFVIAPLKGLPVAQGFNPARMWIGPLVNGVWGAGTAVLFGLFRRRR
jgi:hypothetical protein